MQIDTKINYDLENSPLQIKTNCMMGDDDRLRVHFLTAEGANAGGFDFKFESFAKYWLNGCSSSWINPPDNLPVSFSFDPDKVWTIALRKSSSTGETHIVVLSNNDEVVNVVMSDSTCDVSDWATFWSKDVEKILFHSDDTASDYYRPG